MHKKNVIVLAYHRVSTLDSGLCVKPQDFSRHMLFFKKNNFHSLLLKDYIHLLRINKPLNKGRYVVITFDDGWEDNYIYAFPILKKYGYVATIFLTVAHIGEKRGYLKWEQVMEMKKAGFEFGSHTLTHPHLTRISTEKAEMEIKKSKEILEEKMGKEVKTFCYPYGDYDQSIIELVKKTGYQGAVVTPPSGRCEESIYTIRRVGLYSTDTMLSFRVKTSRLTQTIASNKMLWLIAKRLKKWLRA